MATTRALSFEDGNLSSSSIITARNRAYSDIDLTFTTKAGGDIYKKTDAAAVKQAVKTLLLTEYGEKPFSPNYGGGLGNLMFELADEYTEEEMKVAIRLAIANWEPRAEVINVDTNVDLDRNSVRVQVVFLIISTNEEVTLETTLSRLR